MPSPSRLQPRLCPTRPKFHRLAGTDLKCKCCVPTATTAAPYHGHGPRVRANCANWSPHASTALKYPGQNPLVRANWSTHCFLTFFDRHSHRSVPIEATPRDNLPKDAHPKHCLLRSSGAATGRPVPVIILHSTWRNRTASHGAHTGTCTRGHRAELAPAQLLLCLLKWQECWFK